MKTVISGISRKERALAFALAIYAKQEGTTLSSLFSAILQGVKAADYFYAALNESPATEETTNVRTESSDTSA